MSINLKSMSVSDLLHLQAAIPAELESRQREERQKLLNEFRDRAKSLGMNFDDMLGQSGKGGKAAKRSGGKVLPKYVHPENTDLTWTGRGKRPRWVVEWLASGKPIESLAV